MTGTTQITIKKIRLKGFLSYKEEVEIMFPRNTIVIIGPNGVGKSSIVEAIYYALTGSTIRGKFQEIINNNSKLMSVELVLETPEGELTILRERVMVGNEPKNKRTMVKLNNTIIANSVEATNRAIAEKIFGIMNMHVKDPKQTISTIIDLTIIKQGYITELSNKLSSGNKEKKEYIDSLLGIDLYEKAQNALGDYEVKIELPKEEPSLFLSQVPTAYRVTETGIKIAKEQLTQLNKNITRLKEEKKKQETQFRTLKEEKDVLEKKLEEIKQKEKQIKDRLDALQEKQREHDRLHIQLREKEEKIRELEEKLETLKEKIRKEKEIQKKYEELLTIYEYKQLEEKIQNATKLLEFYKKQLGLELNRNTILEKTGIKEKEELDEKIKKTDRELALLQKQYEEKKEKQKTLGILQNKIRELKEKIVEKIQTTINKEIQTTESPGEAAKNLYEQLRDKEANLSKEISLLKKELKETTDLLLEINKAEGKCPLCGRELTKEHREKLRQEFEEKIKNLENRLSEKEKQYIETKDKTRVLKTLIEDVIKRLEEIIAEHKTLLKDLENYPDNIEELIKEKTIQLEKLENIKDEIEKNEKKINEIIVSTRFLEETLGLRPEISTMGLEEKIKCLTQQLSKDEKVIKELANELGKKGFNIEKITELSVDELKKKTEETKLELERITWIKQQYNSYLNEKEKTLIEANRIKEEIKALEYDEKELEKARKEYEEINTMLSDISSKKGQLDTEIKTIAKNIIELEKTINYGSELKERLKNVLYQLEVLYHIRSLYHTDKIPKYLRTYVINRLREEMMNILAEFELFYDDVEIDENVNITLVNRSQAITVGLAQTSGGEKTSIILSFLLAMKKLVQELKGESLGLGFMILDEPTMHLDREKRTNLIQILKKARSISLIPQMIIVTHDEELREAGDTILLVKKEGDTSKVERIYG